MKTTATQKSAVQISIDKQLQEILENEIRNIKNVKKRSAVFLQLFVA